MRLFVFGIGGTGSRVLEALAFLLASGVELTDAQNQPVEVIPMLLDPDKTNKDTLDGISALEMYQRIHEKRDDRNRVGFFSTKLAHLASVAKITRGNSGISESFRLNFEGLENVTFRDFIQFNRIQDPITRRIIESLYSEDNLNDKLTGGFLGNPNVGSIVLSGFEDSADFSLFVNSFANGDRIFIVGSIFGGTGAAGLPWLLKALRSERQIAGAAGAIRSAPIGALMVLPYFNIQDDAKSPIESNVFIAKTKAALSYYASHVYSTQAHQGGFDSVYYISDTAMTSYPNHPTGQQQSNEAHILELLGAESIIRFAQASQSDFAQKTKAGYYEYAIDANTPVLNFKTIGKRSSQLFAKSLTQLHMLALLNAQYFRHSSNKTWAKENGFDKSFFDGSGFAEGLSHFLEVHYQSWIHQLSANKRSFSPFELATDVNNMTRLRTDQVAQKRTFRPQLGSELFEMKANSLSHTVHGASASLASFLNLWWRVTSSVFDDSYDSF
jgi:hypothetical protein